MSKLSSLRRDLADMLLFSGSILLLFLLAILFYRAWEIEGRAIDERVREATEARERGPGKGQPW